MKIGQRKHQKAKHKLKFTQNAKPAITYVGSVSSSPDSSLGSPNEMTKNTDKELEVDFDVVEMTFAMAILTVHISNSLLEGRKDAYRCELDRES